MMQTAKSTWQKGCQVITLPEGFCVEGTEFQIGRLGSSILITPVGAEPVASRLLPANVPPNDEAKIVDELAADVREPSATILRHPGPAQAAQTHGARLSRALCGWLKFG